MWRQFVHFHFQAILCKVCMSIEKTDQQLFTVLKYNPIHRLLQPEHSTPYLTHARVYNYKLPFKTTGTQECNFMYRILSKNCF